MVHSATLRSQKAVGFGGGGGGGSLFLFSCSDFLEFVFIMFKVILFLFTYTFVVSFLPFTECGTCSQSILRELTVKSRLGTATRQVTQCFEGRGPQARYYTGLSCKCLVET